MQSGALLAAAVVAVAAVVGTIAWVSVLKGQGNASEVVPHSESSSGTEQHIDHDRLLAAFAAIDEGVVIVDDAGREILRNPMAARYQEPMSGDALVADAVQRLLDVARAGRGGSEELSLFGPPSTIVSVHAVPLTVGDDRVGAVAWVRDISETRRTDQVRRDFVANVSHELKTPIGALTLLAETMAVADDAVVQQQLADRVLREADRLAQIVEDLLDLSALEAHAAPEFEMVPVALIVGDAIDQVRPKADAAGIPVTPTLEGDLFVTCDRRQLTSAVTNLLDNAVKYSDAGGVVEVSVMASGPDLTIGVRDHGVGIPARDLERVFERFYRVDRARSRDTGGTGLGLSIVRHVVQAHGGDVSVASVEGAGSEFMIRIPRTSVVRAPTLAHEGLLS